MGVRPHLSGCFRREAERSLTPTRMIWAGSAARSGLGTGRPLLQGMESSPHLLVKAGNGGRIHKKDVKNEECSSEFVENKGQKKCSSGVDENKQVTR